jgi:hypothetical protein
MHPDMAPAILLAVLVVCLGVIGFIFVENYHR